MRVRIFSATLIAAFLSSQVVLAEAPIGQTVRAIEIVQASKDTEKRKLTANDPVFQNELVETGADSYAGVTLNDSTSLAIGPNSSVLLDDFVYTPGSDAGTVVMTMTKGALRFVTGKLDSQSYKIRTPTATIGIRGTIILILVGLNGQTTLFVQQGIASVTNLLGQTTVIETSGQSSTVDPSANNGTPSPPGPPPPSVIALLQALASLQPAPAAPGTAPPESAGVTITVVGNVVIINAGPTLAQLTTGGANGTPEDAAGEGLNGKVAAGAGLAAAAAAALLLLLNQDDGSSTTTTTTTTTTTK